ncbi:protein-export membrane protein SecD [Sulfoacidibacillus thermotolerans]|uniref:Protein translocase subunit SecD n=1 Tax=Sulfoacidibacillus thermotolerans TaxID=1765684 RepID=A0A2U3DBD0_SULT2|nr:protein-export membrane protein SecD [Sulfoacidibacillus thermotolerans]
MKWGRLTTFIVLVVAIFAIVISTSSMLYKKIPLGLDLQGGFEVLYQVGNSNQTITARDMSATVAALENRVNALGVSEPSIEVENGNRIRVSLAGQFNQVQARNFLSKEANLEFKSPTGQVLMTGKDLESNAHYEADPTTGAPEVAVQFKDPALFQAITQKYLGQPISIWLNGRMIDNPVIKDVITNGQATISGSSSAQAAIQLAELLNAGALPFPLHELSSTSVGPTLGQAALHSTLLAGAIGVALIFLFMIIMYRVPGLIAVVALIAYSYVLLAVFAGMQVTLTLTGLAALVLGIGMAVDANIITYERIKDELRSGKSLQSSVIAGQRKAIRTILDSNVTTLIAGIVMYGYGTGDVRGFAVALIASIIVSLLTAVLLSRTLLLLFIKANVVKNTWLFGISRKVANPS